MPALPGIGRFTARLQSGYHWDSGDDNYRMCLPTLLPSVAPTRAGREPAPARACGRRSHHTRRYVATLIHLARTIDASALERLQMHARRQAHGKALGLDALAQTLSVPKPR
jgi:hypothetical protein